MDDLEERLRAGSITPEATHTMTEAADRIEALEAKLAVAREALKPFAECCEQISCDEDGEEWAKFRLLIKDYRRARQALKELDND